jgi:hypothetical protein
VTSGPPYRADLGGAERLTEAQRTLITQAATLQERTQANMLRGELVDAEQLTRLANAVTRCLARLGKRAPPATRLKASVSVRCGTRNRKRWSAGPHSSRDE